MTGSSGEESASTASTEVVVDGDSGCCGSHDHAIVPYNGTFARYQRNRHLRRVRYHSRREVVGVNAAKWVAEGVPPMPFELKQLIYNGIPIASRLMHNAMTNEPYYKFNGLKERRVKAIAEYLVCIPRTDRANIIEDMLMNTRQHTLTQILSEYQDIVRNLMHKNNYRLQANVPVVCDQVGVLH